MPDPVSKFAAGLAEDSLGLPAGEADPSAFPKSLADKIRSAMEGMQESFGESPALQEELNSYGAALASEALRERGHFALKLRWPMGVPYAACVTHDVDNVRRPLRHILSVRDRFSAPDLALALLGLRSLYNNIDLVATTERKKGIHSSYYFLTTNYDLGSMAAQLARLEEEGWDLGLHGSFGTHDSPEKMKEDVARFTKALGHNPLGVREHFLQFDYAKTWQVMEEAGFAYDTTVGTRDVLGFRIGLCTPFHPPTPNWTPMRLLELPLVLMDTTLWGYMKLSERDGLEKVRGLLAAVAGVGGLFTMLWHQESVRMKGGRIFADVLGELVKGGAYVGSGAEIADWWAKRGVSLLRRGDVYSLSGEPPPGLCIELFARDGLVPVVKGGTVERSGGRYLIKALSGGFRMVLR